MGKNQNEFVKEITPQGEDFSQWYTDVIKKADMVDYAPVKGCMVIKPYGYRIWELIQAAFGKRFKETGHQNAYFPIFIPESFFCKEAEHVEGFAPEVAWVTHGGGEGLPERLAVRPTSETMVCAMYAKWIQSWRDLPVLINQWCNVVRWEKATRPFLRTTEFLWQEGHTAHATAEEAEEETRRMLDVYAECVEGTLAIPVLRGQKTEREKFAGAVRTYCIEALMRDGRALQAGTSHNLGQHFAKVFNITYLDKNDQLQYVWQTSWGVSTRLIGALIMVHGDDRGLVLPPKVAPLQVVIVPIGPAGKREAVLARARQLHQELQAICRVHLDDREEYTPGWKFNDWEMRGVPLRLEIGPRDMEKNQVLLVRRDSGEKCAVAQDDLAKTVQDFLAEIQLLLFERARRFREDNTHQVADKEEFDRVMENERGFILAAHCGEDSCELHIKEQTGATIRCLPFTAEPVSGRCVYCDRPAQQWAYFARAY
jgi:prolyl-tRNA synthetase